MVSTFKIENNRGQSLCFFESVGNRPSGGSKGAEAPFVVLRRGFQGGGKSNPSPLACLLVPFLHEQKRYPPEAAPRQRPLPAGGRSPPEAAPRQRPYPAGGRSPPEK